MEKNQFKLEVIVHGRPVTEYLYKGETFVEGRRGSKYVIRARNGSYRRVVVVISVDGLSVMDGQSATKNDSGYIIPAHDFVDIPGWRLDDKGVAHFLFDDLPESYASQMGKPKNIGVIGAVFYREKRTEIPKLFFGPPSYPKCGSDPHIYGSTSNETRRIGTGFGSRTDHKVSSVEFKRENHPAAIFILRYDDRKGLKKRGIQFSAPHPEPDLILEARPFSDSGCAPPPGWNG